MKGDISLGCAPYGEECVQVGTPNYAERARRECWVYRDQVIRTQGKPPTGAALVIKSFPHDFGSYLEVLATYDDTLDESVAYAVAVESDLPEHWDEEAIAKLKELNR